jgi:uncharacterized repeat protein (TIGR01451 family)
MRVQQTNLGWTAAARSVLARAGSLGLVLLVAALGILSLPALGSPIAQRMLPVHTALAASCPQPLSLINGSFEEPEIPDDLTKPAGWEYSRPDVKGIWYVPEDDVPGWDQVLDTGLDADIEFWENPSLFQNGQPFGPLAYDGDTYIELNGYALPGAIGQNIDTSALQNETLTWSFAHQGRNGPDTIALRIGEPGVAANFEEEFTSGAGDWSTYSGTYTVPAGQTTTRIEFAAVSTSNGILSDGNFLDGVSLTTPVCATDLAVIKIASAETFTPGGPVGYTIAVTNTGSAPGQYDVEGARLVDDIPADIGDVIWTCAATPGSACGSASGTGNAIDATFDILEGGSVIYTVSGVLSVAVSGSVSNTATVTLPETAPNGEPIVDANPDNNTSIAETAVAQPGIGLDAVADYLGPLNAGDTVPFRFVVTNTGSSTLTDVTVTSSLPGLGAISPASAAILPPRASQTFTALYLVTQADADRGSITASAEVSGTAPSGSPVSGEDSVTIEGQANPAATLTTTSSVFSGMPVSVGDSISYSFTVTNTGNITLEEISVSDSLPGLSAIAPASIAALAPGESAEFTAVYVVTQEDLDAGEIADTATASMQTTDACTTCPSPPQPSSTNVIAIPQAQVVQLAMGADPVADAHAGETITYTFAVMNTGNVTLAGVEVSSDLPGLSWVNGPGLGTLAPGESATAIATYVVTAEDAGTGVIRAVATVTGYPPDTCAACMPASATTALDVLTAPPVG